MTTEPEFQQAVRDRIAAEWAHLRLVHIRSDFDGTATDFIRYPEESQPEPAFVSAFNRYVTLKKATVGIITGRYLAFATERFPDPKIELDCSYGAEHRRDGITSQSPTIVSHAPALAQMQQALLLAIQLEGGRTTTSSREAEENGWLYIETAPTKIAAHTRAGAAKNPDIVQILDRAVARLDHEPATKKYFGLIRKYNNMNVEYDITDTTGHRIDKRDVMARLIGLDAHLAHNGVLRDADDNVVYDPPPGATPNFVMFSGDDTGDLGAARLVHENEGVVIAVRQPGTPVELLEMADFVFNNAVEHSAFHDSFSQSLVDLERAPALGL